MRPFNYYIAVYLGKKFKDEPTFLQCFRMAERFATHLVCDGARLDMENKQVLNALCIGAELLLPYLGNPYVTEERFDGYTLKVENGRLFQELSALLQMHLPQNLLYRGVC